MVKDEDQNILESFSSSSQGQLTTNFDDKSKPFVVRGVVKRKEIKECEKENRDYYYIDTGYVGNFPSKGNSSGKKIWHRVVKNDVQHTKVEDRPNDRWNILTSQDPRLIWSGWKNYNQKILLYRNQEYSIYDAFNSGVYATVAFNSIAALESVLYGIPAFVSVPCAATPLASTDLSMLKNPFRPEVNVIQKQCHTIAYGQFSVGEISNGTAYKILNNL